MIPIIRQGPSRHHPILAHRFRACQMGAFYGFPTDAEPGAVQIVPAREPPQIAAVRELIAEYAAALGRDLSFQGFDGELAGLPGDYAPPGGCLLLALAAQGAAGCVALRASEGDAAEMKRLYVRPPWRKAGLGETLARAVLAEARRLGYRRVRLDTLPEMERAQALYRRLGFRPIAPYYESPIAGTSFLELTLE